MNWQIQSIPTPNVYESKGGGIAEIDTAQCVYALDSFVAVFAQPVTPPTEESAVSLALDSMFVNGPQPLPASDGPTVTLALQSFVNVTPQGISQSDGPTVTLALQSFVNVTPQTISNSDETTVGLALESMVV